MAHHQWTRRDLLQTAAAFSLPVLVPGRILGREGKAPPSETVRIGVIGCGGRASGLIGHGADVNRIPWAAVQT